MDGMIHAYKTVRFKVFASNHRDFERFCFIPPKGELYTKAGIENLKKILQEQLSQQFPEATFNFVAIKPNIFNVVHKLGHA